MKTLIGLFVSFSCTLGVVNAQERTDGEEQIQRAWTEATVIVDGAESPEEIPTSAKIAHFLRFFSGNWERLKLSEPDAKPLLALADTEEQRRESDHGSYISAYLSNCHNLHSRDPLELAISVDEIASGSHKPSVERFNETLSQISPSGRETVWQFIEEEVTPNIGFVSHDNVSMASSAPEVFRDSVISACIYYSSETPTDAGSETQPATGTVSSSSSTDYDSTIAN